MTERRPIGVLQGVDEQGYLINPASREAIVAPWLELVEALVEGCSAHLGEDLHSLYIRGSVAQGRAIEGTSDLDALFVAKGLPEYWFDRWGATLLDDLEERFTFCDSVELECVPMAALWKHRRYGWVRFHLKTQAACVFGEDLAPRLPSVRPGDPASLLHAPHLAGWLKRFRRKLPDADPDERRDLCQHIMKFLVRSGFDVVMRQEGTYTRDLVRCARAFARRHPSRAASMYRALELAIEPTSEEDEALSLLDDLGAWIVGESLRLEP